MCLNQQGQKGYSGPCGLPGEPVSIFLLNLDDQFKLWLWSTSRVM